MNSRTSEGMIEKIFKTAPDTKMLKICSNMQHTRKMPAAINGNRETTAISASVRLRM